VGVGFVEGQDLGEGGGGKQAGFCHLFLAGGAGLGDAAAVVQHGGQPRPQPPQLHPLLELQPGDRLLGSLRYAGPSSQPQHGYNN
jgi:hypothetical protein